MFKKDQKVAPFMHGFMSWKVYEIHIYPYVHEETPLELEVSTWSEAVHGDLHGGNCHSEKIIYEYDRFMQLFRLFA